MPTYEPSKPPRIAVWRVVQAIMHKVIKGMRLELGRNPGQFLELRPL